MGPEATEYLFRRIIENTEAKRDQDHVPVLIYNNTAIGDRTTAILSGDDRVSNQLVESANLLERMGADLLVMACNTAHYYVPEIMQGIQIPFLSILDVTVQEARARDLKRVLLLGTIATYQTGLYADKLTSQSIEVVLPTPADKQLLMDIIYLQIKTGKYGNAYQELKAIVDRSGEAEAVILGCTELSLFAEQFTQDQYEVLDPVDILAREAIRFAGGKLKP